MHLPPLGIAFSISWPACLPASTLRRADIGDALAVGRVAVGGEQRDLAADAVQRVAHGLGIDRAHHDAGDARGDEIVHHAGLDRGRRLLGILEDQRVVRQLALRLLDAGLGRLPEIGGAVDDEGQGLLVRRLCCSGKAQQSSRGDGGNQHFFHDRSSLLMSATMRSPTDLISMGATKSLSDSYSEADGIVNLPRMVRRYANNMKLLRCSAAPCASTEMAASPAQEFGRDIPEVPRHRPQDCHTVVFAGRIVDQPVASTA